MINDSLLAMSAVPKRWNVPGCSADERTIPSAALTSWGDIVIQPFSSCIRCRSRLPIVRSRAHSPRRVEKTTTPSLAHRSSACARRRAPQERPQVQQHLTTRPGAKRVIKQACSCMRSGISRQGTRSRGCSVYKKGGRNATLRAQHVG